MGGDLALKEIQIQNVRSLKNTGTITLAPITLLVGENSSGKSTFLRMFPLIKQSISKRTDGPLLWAGDVDDYVDFGSFQETVTKDQSDSMTFSFTFDLVPNRYSNPFYYFNNFQVLEEESSFKVTYSITIIQKNEKEYVSALNITLNDINVSIEPSYDNYSGSLCINDEHLSGSSNSEYSSQKDIMAFWDFALMSKNTSSSIFGFKLPNISHQLKSLAKNFPERKTSKTPSRPFNLESAFILFGELLFKSISMKDIPAYISKNYSLHAPNKNQLISYFEAIVQTYDSFPPAKKQHTLALFMAQYFYCLFPQIDDYLNTYFRQVHYIAPLRATAERYYRLRNLAIDEVDYQGKNLAIFLNSLSKSQLTDFQMWTLAHFGFKIMVEPDGGHLSVKVSLANSSLSVNLSDTGFGYSQILPIITQLWELTAHKNGNSNGIPIPLVIAIEQPELHLHPAMQAKLAEAFIASIRRAHDNGRQLQLLLETHSQTIVNYFGTAIAKGQLGAEEIVTVLFNKDLTTGQTIVQTSQYDSDGYLNNWPLGFLAPGE